MIIQSIFDECNYLTGIKLVDDYVILETELPISWVIPQHEKISHSREKNKTNPTIGDTVFYCGRGEVSIDDIIDFIKFEIVKINKEREEKEILLNNKIEELKLLFESKTLSDLKKEDPIETLVNTKQTKQIKKKEADGVTE